MTRCSTVWAMWISSCLASAATAISASTSRDDCFAKGTHCVELTESTIEANKRFFASEDEVPRRAYSMGIHTIMTAKKVLVVASGEDKAWAIRESCFGPVTPKVPGSILQLHNDAIVIADEAALSLCGDLL